MSIAVRIGAYERLPLIDVWATNFVIIRIPGCFIGACPNASAHSYRNAVTGSSRVACHAGHRQAVMATVINNSEIETSVAGSAG